MKATLRLGDTTEVHVPRGLFRRGPGGLGLQLSRPAPRGPCPGALRVVAAAFASGLLTLSQGFPHPRMFCVRRPHSSLLQGLSCLPLTRVVEGVRSSLFLGLCLSSDALPGQSQLHPARLLLAGAKGPGPTTVRSLLPGLMKKFTLLLLKLPPLAAFSDAVLGESRCDLFCRYPVCTVRSFVSSGL